MPETANVGIIGCGRISGAYLNHAQRFKAFDVTAVADLRLEAAEARAKEFNIPKACLPDQLLADPDIETVIVLTPHKWHGEVGISVLEAGKNVYIEKPFAVELTDANRMVELAAEKGLRAGAAPDTFFGGAWQTARSLIDDGAVGEPIGAFICLQARMGGPWKRGSEPGAEAPDHYENFYITDFFEYGVTWSFDRGPYYLNAVIHLMGPAKRVAASATNPWPERDRGGRKFECNTPTHFTGVIDFANGAAASFHITSDVIGLGLPHVEIYGSDGSLRCIDPNNFGGRLRLKKANGETTDIDSTFGYNGNSRGVGVADMCSAIRAGRPHRASGEMGRHVVEIIHALHTSSSEGRHVVLESTCPQPAALPSGLEDWEID